MASKLDSHIGEVVAWRLAGLSFEAIRARLTELHGLEISSRGLSGCYRRRQSRARKRIDETAPLLKSRP